MTNREIDALASNLTTEQMETQLAAEGWDRYGATIWVSPCGSFYRGPVGAWKAMKELAVALVSTWNPLESIADAYEMEAAIPEAQRADYLGHLECACVPMGKFNNCNPAHIWALAHATPRQRCDAAIAMLEAFGDPENGASHDQLKNVCENAVTLHGARAEIDAARGTK